MSCAARSARAVPALLLLVLHGVAAVLWWSALPQGFPLLHPRFWSNTALPLVIGAACVLALLLWLRRADAPACVVWLLAGLWLGAAVTLRVLFPSSLPFAFAGGAMGALVLASCARLAFGGPWATARVLGAIPGIAIGAVLAFAQRAPEPTTRPANVPFALVGETRPWQASGEPFEFNAFGPTVSFLCGGLKLTVEPLLTFRDGSPDRCWSNLAPWGTVEERRVAVPPQALADGTRGFQIGYEDAARSTLEVRVDGDALELESRSLLVSPVYAHLDSFVALRVEGGARQWLSFSPVPRAQVEVRPFDYPVGRPIRAAYLDASGRFRIVEAGSGEKGPFTTVGEGPLDGPLSIDVLDERGPACRITLRDWAAQVSTALSPTAGWGLPQNAIEFARLGVLPAESWILVTLAATSLGRGWDTVGHGPGVYRNRVRLEPLRRAEPERAPRAPVGDVELR